MMYDGKPYLNEIEQAKSAVSIPVIANGGIYSIEDANRVMDCTGADGVMLARYGLENPFIFSELTGLSCKKTPKKPSADCLGSVYIHRLPRQLHHRAALSRRRDGTEDGNLFSSFRRLYFVRNAYA